MLISEAINPNSCKDEWMSGAEMSSVNATPRNFQPQNPETFFRAQKRNRRATWRLSALSAFAAIIMGVPLTLVLTPLLYVLTLAGAEIINHFSPLPPEFWQNA